MNKQASAKKIGQMIFQVRSHVEGFNKSVQHCAVHILWHAMTYGDYDQASVLVDSLGNSVRASNLVKWFTEFGGLTVKGKGFKGWQGKEFIAENFEKAKATNWWDMEKPVNPYAGYNINTEVAKLLKRHATITKKVVGMTKEDQEKVETHINEGMIHALINLIKFETIATDSFNVPPSPIDLELKAEFDKLKTA